MAKARAKKTKTKKKKAATEKASAKKLPPKAKAAVKKAAEAIWGAEEPPHDLLQELYDVLLLRCLEESGGVYARAAARFGPSRQLVQQYTNSPLRDGRWKQFQR